MGDNSDTKAGTDEGEASLAIEGAVYADAVWRIRPILDCIEGWLDRLPDGVSITAARALPEVAALHGVYDQVALSFHALASIAALRRASTGYVVDRERFTATKSFRLGVRVGLDKATATSQIADVPRLVAALPHGLPEELAEMLRRTVDDLRSALIALITGAHSDITLIAPFWDQETVQDLEDLLVRRLAAGISITIVGRRPKREFQHAPRDFAHLAASLAAHPGFRALVWEEPQADDPFGTQTFHFKAVVIDGGRRSYLGTANFTRASLRSRMEIGVILAGEPSARLARVISGVLSIAQSF